MGKALVFNPITGNLDTIDKVPADTVKGTLTTNSIPKASGAHTLVASKITETAIGIDVNGALSAIGSSANTLDALSIDNESTANNTAKKVRMKFKISDTVGVKKDVAYIEAYVDNSNATEGGLDFYTHSGQATPTKKATLDKEGKFTAKRVAREGGSSSEYMMADGSVSTVVPGQNQFTLVGARGTFLTVDNLIFHIPAGGGRALMFRTTDVANTVSVRSFAWFQNNSFQSYGFRYAIDQNSFRYFDDQNTTFNTNGDFQEVIIHNESTNRGYKVSVHYARVDVAVNQIAIIAQKLY
jgi:hypothetical protein